MAQNSYMYKIMIGVGGIGSGSFFLLNGNQTIGREESRSGRFLDRKDYCKLHIISHYVKVLLGAEFPVLPIGKIGNDEVGKKLLVEMKEIGLTVDYIGTDDKNPTLFSFCLLYPDKSGGNLTIDNSASAAVEPEFVTKAEKEFKKHKGKGIALAAPEVPIEARIKLLELATKYNFFRVASFTSEELVGIKNSNILNKVDLLSINFHEAASLLHIKADSAGSNQIVKNVVASLSSIKPNLIISITKGKEGSFVWDGTEIFYISAMKVKAISTAGAGDAFTSGLIAGITSGFSVHEAQQLAILTASYSVTSPNTINKDLNKKALMNLAQKNNYTFSEKVINFLKG